MYFQRIFAMNITYHHQKLLLTCYETQIYSCVSFIVQHQYWHYI